MPKNNKEWWFVDQNGRRIGYMWPEDMLANIESIWGYRQGNNGFARYTGLHPITISQYTRGHTPIPKHIALLVQCLVKIMLDEGAHKKAHPWRSLPRIDAEWLPKPDDEYEIERIPYK